MPASARTLSIASCLGLGVASFAVYAVLGLRISQGHYLEYWNLLFDLDSEAYAGLLTRPLAEIREPGFGIVKHPLFTWLAVPARGWLNLGLSPFEAASLTTATAGAVSVMVFWGVMRVVGAQVGEANVATALFAVGATQMFNGFLTDSYPFASLSIVVMLLFGLRRIRLPGSNPIWFGASAVFAFGITVTNIAQAVILDIVGRLSATWQDVTRSDRRRAAIRRVAVQQVRFLLACAVIAILLLLATWWQPLIEILSDPFAAAKQVLWAGTKGETTGALTVLRTFFGYAFVAPEFTLVDLPEHVMRDFRHNAMPFAGYIALPVWLVFWIGMGVLSLAHRTTRAFAFALAGCIAFNVLFHLGFQFRFSVFLYTGHVWAPIAAMVGVGLVAARTWSPVLGRGVQIVAVALVLLAAVNNLPRGWEAATAFDSYPPFDRPPMDLPAAGVTRPPSTTP